MDLVSIALVSGALLAFALVSGRLQGTIVTPPVVFIVFGYLLGKGVLGIANVDPGHGAIHVIAELTLILVLFSDAARINLAQLRRDHNLPLRMLLIGLPLIHGRRGVGCADAVSAARLLGGGPAGGAPRPYRCGARTVRAGVPLR